MIDIGCGFGDTTQRLAELAGPAGSALGVDVSAPFIETAREEAEEAGLDKVEFRLADVQTLELPQDASTTPSRAWGSCSSPTRSPPCATSARR